VTTTLLILHSLESESFMAARRRHEKGEEFSPPVY
jgi:hypothetical protein